MSKRTYIKVDKPIKVGDLVRCARDDGECKSGDIRKVSRLGKNREWFFYTCGSEFPRSNDCWEPVRKENRRAEMKQKVAEMIVELLDKEDKENCPQSSVRIANWRDLDNAVTVRDDASKSYEATLHPPDTWDTLTGVYVALSKATGRKLPDWIYGEEE